MVTRALVCGLALDTLETVLAQRAGGMRVRILRSAGVETGAEAFVASQAEVAVQAGGRIEMQRLIDSTETRRLPSPIIERHRQCPGLALHPGVEVNFMRQLRLDRVAQTRNERRAEFGDRSGARPAVQRR